MSREIAPARRLLLTQLSSTEDHLIRSVLAGHTTYLALGRAMHIQRGTVRAHLAHIRSKLDCRNMTEIVLWAVRNGYEIPSPKEP